jgi:transcription antitermination factor NusB
MKSRRACREAALQALYQCDVIGDYSPAAVNACLSHFCYPNDSSQEVVGDLQCNEEERSFCLDIALGVLQHMKVIDDQIGLASTNWSIGRMPRVDRNILRLAVYELMFRLDIPPRVTINEAIEIAKEFSADDAPTFINGVLDRVLSSLPFRLEISGDHTNLCNGPAEGC